MIESGFFKKIRRYLLIYIFGTVGVEPCFQSQMKSSELTGQKANHRNTKLRRCAEGLQKGAGGGGVGGTGEQQVLPGLPGECV